MSNDTTVILEALDLSVRFAANTAGQTFFSKPTFNALSHVSFTLKQACTLGVVGESGSGKTTLAKTLVGLYPPATGTIRTADFIMASRDIQFVFQDPLAALNPRMTVTQLILEPLDYVDFKFTNEQRETKLKKVMQQVGLDYSQRHRYAHEFSGGQCQRIGIARAIITEPKILICDEPVSALDVSIRAQIINLLNDLQVMQDMTLLFIAHDLSLVRFISDELMVMYQGRVIEQGKTDAVFDCPGHPYTQSLIATEPRPDPVSERKRASIDMVKTDRTLANELACAYAVRCKFVQSQCTQSQPQLRPINEAQNVACFYPLE